MTRTARPLAPTLILALVLALPLALLGSAPLGAQQAPSAADDTAAILATVQALFDGMAARDSAVLGRVLLPSGSFTVVVLEAAGDSLAVVHQSLATFIARIAEPGPLLRERFWQPRVLIDGDFATVWTPYDFHLGDEFSHCGTDVFTLARMRDGWRITGGSYTIRRTGCPAGGDPQ